MDKNARIFATHLSRRFVLGAGAALATLPLLPRGAVAQAATVLNFGMLGDGAFGKLDPHYSNGDVLVDAVNNFVVFESLTRQTNDGGLELILADSIEPEEETGTIWVIKLKQGVKFHDGREMKAEDVIASLKAIGAPGTISGGHIGPVETFEAVDDHTVRVTLAAPRSWFPTGLSDPFSSMVPADFDPAKPVGTGPYRVTDVTASQSATLTRFDGYHGTPAKSETISVRFFQDQSAMINALKSGQIDVVRGIDPSVVDEVKDDPTLAVYQSPAGKMMPIQMRTDVAPYSDPRLRKALRLVLDREAVLYSVYNGYAEIGNDLYGRYDPNFATDLVRERNVAEAKQLIEEAGLSGTTLELAMYSDVGTALVLAENAKEIGINIDVKQLDGATFCGEEYFQRPFFGGDYYPSGPYFLQSSLIDAPHAGLDQIKWRDQEYFDLWTAASSTTDAAKIAEIMHKMQNILFERGAWIIAVYPEELGVTRAGVTGLPDHDYTGAGVIRSLPAMLPPQA